MQKFKYVAVNIEKRKFKGTFLAENEEHLKTLLSEQKLFLISCKAVSDKSPNLFFSVSGKLKTSELTSFCRQFSIMTNSGIAIVNCLEILKEQSYSSYFKKVLSIVHEDVVSGLLLSEALKKHKKVFPEFFSSMTYVGEMSGSLDVVLVNLADYYENESKMKKRAKAAMSYPLTLLALVIAVLAIMMIFVVPTFKESLAQLDIEMPAITMIIFNMSNFFVNSWSTILLVVIVIFLIIKLVKRTEKGKYFFDTLKIKLPLIGKTQTNLITSRFARGFGILLNSGMNIVDAMEIIANVLGNKNVEKRFRMAMEDVKRGMNITVALNGYKIFPQILLQMISVGEKTGELDSVLLRSCSYFDDEVESSYAALTATIQPVMLCILGVTIGFVFIGIYSPMLSIMNGL